MIVGGYKTESEANEWQALSLLSLPSEYAGEIEQGRFPHRIRNHDGPESVSEPES